ncbi:MULTISPECIES: hypothetical protein [unclassified Mesorhizobium]|uniref:hypothetical protein n=2 Tax=Mesorhizobium TaxID=68287 RepID=UPI000FCB696F|nr:MULTISPECIES: hypothetical protein [unclassified Mesorhizobium]RUW72456.1 hypothetical protein EOA31_15430 [Mesorhizobium sp. M4B.F.Ca.ET.049.02.1.2]RWC95631.1 MAG: hypothetical protein EOS32_11905 [Mesorhizobium sp.]TGV22340.1 hypothetical protein EN786_30610 [Mesorhizobium sp. M4B.F.Ca.ET.143.01.1.1]
MTDEGLNEAMNALTAARDGDLSPLIARIADQSVTLTFLERAFIIEQLAPKKKGRKSDDDEIEIYQWYRQAVGLSHKDAITATTRALKGNIDERSCEAIEKQIRRKRNIDLGQSFKMYVEFYKQGSRSQLLLPAALRDPRLSLELVDQRTE